MLEFRPVRQERGVPHIQAGKALGQNCFNGLIALSAYCAQIQCVARMPMCGPQPVCTFDRQFNQLAFLS
ncbi:hypothetical protein A7X76_13975 [Stenotrophomonas maltophilia]|nr:hypothetical protein A7X76_13975 [Stenotrophomonas maltophilia]